MAKNKITFGVNLSVDNYWDVPEFARRAVQPRHVGREIDQLATKHGGNLVNTVAEQEAARAGLIGG